MDIDFPADVTTRFWAHVPERQNASDCWLWAGAINPKGYGIFSVKVDGKWKAMLAHRFSWLVSHCEAIASLHVCHSCDVPGCVNPSHLFMATNYENRQDSVSKGRHANGDRSGARRHPERVPRGIANGQSRLTESAVIEIRLRAAQGEAPTDIAVQFGISPRNVRNIINRDTWKHI